MVIQCLETALKNLDTVVDGDITTLNRANAKAGVHLELSTGYPPHTYTPWEKGKKTKFDTKNKMMVKIECDNKNKSILMNAEVRIAWKKELRKYVGIRSFVLVLPEEETASMPTMNRYKEVIAMHTVNNQTMSGVELTRIMELDKQMELTIIPFASADLDDDE